MAEQDSTATRFGQWTVLGPDPDSEGRCRLIVRCGCGKVASRDKYSLMYGGTKSCLGCSANSKPKVAPEASVYSAIIGKRFGRLVVTGVRRGTHGRFVIVCACDCGTESVTRSARLWNGTARSCGCLRRELNTTHGQTPKGNISKTYSIWNAMIGRCTRPNDAGHANYGGRGITLDPKWSTFEGFYADMGEKPPGLSLDRIDSDGNYNKGNCRWADRATQNSNKRNNHYLTLGDTTMTITAWARKLGTNNGTLLARIKRGWPIESVLTPLRAMRY